MNTPPPASISAGANAEIEVTDEMLVAAMRAFEVMSSVLRYREKDKWHTCDMIGMRHAIQAALNTRAATPSDEVREALTPFAKAAETFDSWKDSMRQPDEANICTFIPESGQLADGVTINYGHCRKALIALSTTGEKKL